MNLTEHMNNLKRLLWVASVLGTVQGASAMNYSNTDLLLVLRKDGFNDVEFDLGSVTNYVGLAPGVTKNVDFDAALATSNFNGSLADVRFLLMAATELGAAEPRVWLTDVYLSAAPTDVTLSKFSQIRSKVSSIGQQATILTASNALPAVIASAQSGSFTYVASDANLTPPGSLGGLTGFPIEALNPASLNFYVLHISVVTPKPPATLLGSFAWNSAGILTFTAGGASTIAAPTVTNVLRSGTTTKLSFQSVSGLKYQLQATSALTTAFAAVGSLVSGDGNPLTLSEASSDPVRFYRVQASN